MIRRLVFALAVFAARNAAAAPCDNGFLLKPGAVIEMTRYNGSHQPMGKLVTTVTSSKVEGDKVTAVETLDNYVGANKASTSVVDVVCDGKNTTVRARNGELMKNLTEKAAAATGHTLLASETLTDPMVYALELKPGLELPSYRTISVTVMQKPQPDWGKIALTGHWEDALAYALDHKISTVMAMGTTHIKVVGQESCAMPEGPAVPCWHITKDVYAKTMLGKAEIAQDAAAIAKGGTAQMVNEWFAPGIGVVKLDIGMGGRSLASMAVTRLAK